MSRLNGFLQGLRVVDLSAYLPGPFASLLLSDMGAEVVKIEPPQPEGPYLNGGAGYYRVYPTADERHVVLGAVEPKFWSNFCTTAGRPDWIARQTEPLPQRALIADLTGWVAGAISGAGQRLSSGPADRSRSDQDDKKGVTRCLTGFSRV